MYLFSYLDPRSGPLDIIIPVVVMAFGMGLGMAQRTNVIASAVPAAEIGIASSILALARNIAGAFGISVFATVLNSAINSNILEIARYSVIHARDKLSYMQGVGLITLKAEIMGYDRVFVISMFVLLVGVVNALFIKAGKDAAKTHVVVE